MNPEELARNKLIQSRAINQNKQQQRQKRQDNAQHPTIYAGYDAGTGQPLTRSLGGEVTTTGKIITNGNLAAGDEVKQRGNTFDGKSFVKPVKESEPETKNKSNSGFMMWLDSNWIDDYNSSGDIDSGNNYQTLKAIFSYFLGDNKKVYTLAPAGPNSDTSGVNIVDGAAIIKRSEFSTPTNYIPEKLVLDLKLKIEYIKLEELESVKDLLYIPLCNYIYFDDAYIIPHGYPDFRALFTEQKEQFKRIAKKYGVIATGENNVWYGFNNCLLRDVFDFTDLVAGDTLGGIHEVDKSRKKQITKKSNITTNLFSQFKDFIGTGPGGGYSQEYIQENWELFKSDNGEILGLYIPPKDIPVI